MPARLLLYPIRRLSRKVAARPGAPASNLGERQMASDRTAPYTTPQALLFAIGALAVFRLGSQIPLPGLDSGALGRLASSPGGGALARLSIFALGVTPIFSVMFIVEIAKMAFPPVARLAASDEGRAPLRGVILIGALALAAVQGLGIAHALESVPDLVDQPGLAYELEIVATFMAATAFLSWLGDRMIAGFWILLIAPTIARLPYFTALTVELGRQGVVGSSVLPIAILFLVLAIALIVLLAGTRLEPFSPFLLSRSGQDRAAWIDVWPPLLAEYVPALVAGALAVILRAPIDLSLLRFGEPLHILLTAVLIAGFWLLRGWAPGGAAASRRPIWPNALAQIVVCCGGEGLTRLIGAPFAIDGAWIIVTVATVLTAMGQVGALLPLAGRRWRAAPDEGQRDTCKYKACLRNALTTYARAALGGSTSSMRWRRRVWKSACSIRSTCGASPRPRAGSPRTTVWMRARSPSSPPSCSMRLRPSAAVSWTPCASI